jgi:hypothetical protein
MECWVRGPLRLIDGRGVGEQTVHDLCPEAVDLGEVPEQIGCLPARTGRHLGVEVDPCEGVEEPS